MSDTKGKKVSRILLIKGSSSFDAVRIFMDELKKGFEKKGVVCDLLDAVLYNEDGAFTSDGYPVLMDFLKKQPDFILSANGILLNNVKKCLLELGLDIPFAGYYVDHPLWNDDRLSFSIPNYYAVFVDDTFTKYAKDYYQGFQTLPTVRQAGILPEKESESFRKRKKSVVFFGSFKDSRKIYRDVESGTEDIHVLVKAMFERGIKCPGETVEEIVLRTIRRFGMEPVPETIPSMISAVRIVEVYLRSYFREKAVETLVENGIKVDVYGNGWETFPVKNKELLHVHPSVSYREMADIMTEYQYSLNVLPWAKNGFHDRIATSMLSGCICVSDGSTYMEKEKLDGEKMLLYHLGREDEMVQKIRTCMESEELAEKIAGASKEYALHGHLWLHRAGQFLKYMQDILDTKEI